MLSSQNHEMWFQKEEPVSPFWETSIEIDEDLFLLNDKSVDGSTNAAESVMYDDYLSPAQAASKYLETLDEFIKEEPFSDWLETKIDLPIIYEELPILENDPDKSSPTVYPIVTKTQQQQHDNTQTLLQEFETVLGDVEACHQVVPPSSSTLTPPQSPSHKGNINVDTQLLITLQPMQSYVNHQPMYNVAVPYESLYVNNSPRQWNTEDIPLDPLSGETANDLAEVEEYVRSHIKDVASPSSPCTSSGGSCISTEDSTDDPDWSLESERKSFKHSVHDSSKSRHKPYSRPSIEDKKVRKKEQNKNAATRYRQKKKQEVKEIEGEERELAEHNEKLRDQVKDLQREIGYLKGLMRDLFKAKGLLK